MHTDKQTRNTITILTSKLTLLFQGEGMGVGFDGCLTHLSEALTGQCMAQPSEESQTETCGHCMLFTDLYNTNLHSL